MQTKRAGRQTVQLSHPPSVVSFANIGGRMEGQGPLSDYFDELSPDTFFGKKTWEQGESAMQGAGPAPGAGKGGLTAGELDYVLAGDLLNQCIGTSFGLRSFHIPFYGLYGACSTMGESLSLAALLIDGGFARLAAAMTSSHYCTAERQYRMPVPYGSQRTPPPSGRPPPPAAAFWVLRGRPLYHPRHLRPHRGLGHHRCQQHGGRHGPRRLRHPAGALSLLPPPPRRTTTSSSPAIWGCWVNRSSPTSSGRTVWT